MIFLKDFFLNCVCFFFRSFSRLWQNVMIKNLESCRGLLGLVLPLRRGLLVGAADDEGAVLLAVDVVPARGLEAHARGVPELHVEGLRGVGVGGEAVGVEVEVLAVLAWKSGGKFVEECMQ